MCVDTTLDLAGGVERGALRGASEAGHRWACCVENRLMRDLHGRAARPRLPYPAFSCIAPVCVSTYTIYLLRVAPKVIVIERYNPTKAYQFSVLLRSVAESRKRRTDTVCEACAMPISRDRKPYISPPVSHLISARGLPAAKLYSSSFCLSTHLGSLCDCEYIGHFCYKWVKKGVVQP